MYRVISLFVCLALVLLAFDVITPPTYAVANVPGAAEPASLTAVTDIEEQVFNAINRVREENHLAPLSVAKDLRLVARSHSQDMAMREYFSHVSPEGDSLQKRITRNGITNWNRIAENIAMNSGYNNPASIAVKGWLESPGHRHNIMDANLTETGIGVATDAKGRIYLTQLFVRRK
ncbi:MAG: CAP domain-containing protein [Acidobacteria bacterium]|nr:CAP domain-containing protein [Acidobacteriota bacterium]